MPLVYDPPTLRQAHIQSELFYMLCGRWLRVLSDRTGGHEHQQGKHAARDHWAQTRCTGMQVHHHQHHQRELGVDAMRHDWGINTFGASTAAPAPALGPWHRAPQKKVWGKVTSEMFGHLNKK